MSQHYYLLASLPSLSLGEPIPLPEQTLRTLVGEHLAPDDVREFDAILAGAGTGAFARAWRAASAQFDDARVRARATRLGVDATTRVEDASVPDLTLASAVADACAATDPKEREWRLDTLRLRQLDELTWDRRFATDSVFAYGLRLRICARWAGRDAEVGRTNLRQHMQRILGAFDA